MSLYDNGPIRLYGVSHVTASPGSNHPEVGTRCREGDEDYLWVYNDGNVELYPAYGVTVTGVSGYSVTRATTTDVDLLVGVCHHATIPTGNYGWVVTRGFVNVQMSASVAAAAGDPLILGTNGQFVEKTSGIGFLAAPLVKAMAAIGSGLSGAAFVNCGG